MTYSRRIPILLVFLAVIAAACAPGGEEEPAETTAVTSATTETTTDEPGETTTEVTDEPDEEVSSEPIRIGLLAPLSGFMAGDGPSLVNGFDLFWEQQGYEVAGRTVEILVEDTATDPDTALNKARLLVEQRDVDMLIGEVLAPSGIAVAGYVTAETDVPYVIPIIGADDLTQRERHPLLLRVAGMTASQRNHPIGVWAVDQGYNSVVTVGSDFNFGHQTVAGFVNTFTDEGGTVLDQLWAPLGTADFAPFIPTIQDLQPDLVFVNLAGGDGLRFMTAWDSFGMDDTDTALLAGEQTLEQQVFEALDELAEGRIVASRTPLGRPAPGTQDFMAAYEETFGEIPTETAALMFAAGMWLVEALEEVEGNLDDMDQFIEAVRAVELEETPVGPMSMDEFNSSIANVWMNRVERRDDGALWLVPFETFEQVGQFWTYDPEEFLAHPVYSSEYQGDGVWPEPNPGG